MDVYAKKIQEPINKEKQINCQQCEAKLAEVLQQDSVTH